MEVRNETYRTQNKSATWKIVIDSDMEEYS
jgi:hypothetical protein